MAAVTDPIAAEPGSYLEPEQSAERPTSVYETVLDRAEADDGLYLPHHDMTIDPHTYLVQVVDIHFDPAFGTPYWREQHADLRDERGDDFDIREQVRIDGYDAIREYLGAADEDALRERPMGDFLPALYTPDDIDISKSSGTTDQKKLMPWAKAVSDAAVDWYDWNLSRRDAGGGDWAVCGPYGLYEKHLEGVANKRDGFAYVTAIEMKYTKDQLAALGEVMETAAGARQAFSRDSLREAPTAAYEALKDVAALDWETVLSAVKGMVRMEPTLTALEEDLQTEPVQHIASAPGVVKRMHSMLEADNTVSSPEDIDTILISGMDVDEQTVDELESMYSSADVIPMYATSFTGPSFPEETRDEISYYPMSPVVDLTAVDEDGRPVEYGERGQVEINRVGPDFFWPNQRERETAVRERPSAPFDWDGISDVRPERYTV